MVLERIKGPADVKHLSPEEMKTLAAEMRNALLHKVSTRAGILVRTSEWWKQPLRSIMYSTLLKIRLCLMSPIKVIRTKC